MMQGPFPIPANGAARPHLLATRLDGPPAGRHGLPIASDFRLAFQLGITAVLGCRVCNQGVRRIQQRPPCYRANDAINPTTQTAITAAVIQPTIFSQDDKVKRPITRGSLAKFIITTMIGAAITPLMTALR